MGLKGEGSRGRPCFPHPQSLKVKPGDLSKGHGAFTWGTCGLPRFAGEAARDCLQRTGMFQTPIPSPFVEGTWTPCQALGACRSISFPQPSHFTKPAGVKRGKRLRAS